MLTYSLARLSFCFVDFKKAFDSIWHDGLFVRMLENKNGKFYNLIKCLYSKTTCFIKLGAKKTKTFEYNRGVRQGCILSPLLFNLYLNNLPNILDNTPHTDKIFLNDAKSHSRQGLQNSLNAMSKFCQD